MPVDRDLWKPPFKKWPNWPCPACRTGRLQVLSESLKVMETGPSEKLRSNFDGWGPEHYQGRFVALFQCGNTDCKNVVAACGPVEQEEVTLESPEGLYDDYEDAFIPTYFQSAPPLFPLPDKCPDEVKLALKSAFHLYWPNRHSCANAMRGAVERLLDELRVKKFVTRAGKRQRVTLHDRIVDLARIRPEVGELLMAVKWMGNDGSHEGDSTLSMDDVMNGFDIFEHVLDALYVKRGARITKLASTINKRKSAASFRRRRA